ncbi:beta-lactamase [Flavobacterium akiainvivens]|uniref:Beta-lactamase n=1 Tax=Flavobacterium akiainvivens TaxID=1202724 RepID=A0A0M9VJL0_9FLAO|nr:MBL fold metallo-hydrolase [Flavobacterium akiainvivens]KOS07869.1 beta-lactamase [Flavobacterium akiainvivens]SFQ27847.1 L-ascorbate metabolism protein UlaG, beta-lactamase superfamily [Flavobacterium akiainvivens]
MFLYILLSILLLLIAAVYLFFQHPKFGKKAKGQRLQHILASPHYRDNEFQNQSYTPNLSEGATMFKVFVKFFFGRDKRNKPSQPIPSQKHDLKNLDPNQNLLVWFGHSSYFIQIDGKTILIDPVLSGYASPIAATTRAFKGSDIYKAEDMPEIDYLFISHDHWDHLDYDTVIKLKPKVKNVVTSLDNGAHLEYWGYNAAIIQEGDWNDVLNLKDGFTATVVPGRHFSGRTFIRNKYLWGGFVLQTPTHKLFLGGDSGYDTHFKTIGEQHGPFDLALLECGQYNEYWHHIHMMPEEVVTAAQELRTKKLMPVHFAKFALALHAWDEPIIRVSAEAEKQGMPLITPLIGQLVNLEQDIIFEKWWETMERG